MLSFRIVGFVYVFVCIDMYVYGKRNTKYSRKEDKLVLKPTELIDMILEERLQKEIPAALERHKANGKLTEMQLCVEEATEAMTIDNASWNERKVWSRWGKWSACSATCGAGAMTRARVCVAGRCARGEREEQRRPCSRPPCSTQPTVHDRQDPVYVNT